MIAVIKSGDKPPLAWWEYAVFVAMVVCVAIVLAKAPMVPMGLSGARRTEEYPAAPAGDRLAGAGVLTAASAPLSPDGRRYTRWPPDPL